MAITHEVKQFMKKHSYMDLDGYEEPNYLCYATREFGDVGEETAGDEDIKHAIKIIKKIKEEFGDKIEMIYMDEVGEWISLEITTTDSK